MPLKVVKVRTDALVWSGVSHAVPKGWTPSRWGRTLVETLVSRPESSKAHRMLKRLGTLRSVFSGGYAVRKVRNFWIPDTGLLRGLGGANIARCGLGYRIPC